MDVLIAHAGPRVRSGLLRVTAAQGLRVLETADGREALDMLLRDDAPRLALVDWDLPGLDGAELCRLVRHYHLAAPPYLILMAAEGSGRDVRLGLEAGANDCLRTPAPTTTCARAWSLGGAWWSCRGAAPRRRWRAAERPLTNRITTSEGCFVRNRALLLRRSKTY